MWQDKNVRRVDCVVWWWCRADSAHAALTLHRATMSVCVPGCDEPIHTQFELSKQVDDQTMSNIWKHEYGRKERFDSLETVTDQTNWIVSILMAFEKHHPAFKQECFWFVCDDEDGEGVKNGEGGEDGEDGEGGDYEEYIGRYEGKITREDFKERINTDIFYQMYCMLFVLCTDLATLQSFTQHCISGKTTITPAVLSTSGIADIVNDYNERHENFLEKSEELMRDIITKVHVNLLTDELVVKCSDHISRSEIGIFSIYAQVADRIDCRIGTGQLISAGISLKDWVCRHPTHVHAPCLRPCTPVALFCFVEDKMQYTRDLSGQTWVMRHTPPHVFIRTDQARTSIHTQQPHQYTCP